MKQAYFVFDVESVGLHGGAFAVAGCICADTGAIQSGFIFACDMDDVAGSEEDTAWVKTNVPLLPITHRSARGIRDAFWEEWSKAKKQYPNIRMAADCGWPVEARFLCACIDDERAARRWEGPYPFVEISSIMMAAGMDPMKEYPRTPSEMPKHNPYTDSVQSARLLFEAIERISNSSCPTSL